ncbi:MAG: TIM barrel protein [Ktedonobacteraceae bacterium]|nr:TIM barrel protein [Ktedonobacteraceae bacterium]
MLNFDLNISILLKEVPFIDRFALAAQLGFGAVELWWPGAELLPGIEQQLQATGLVVALMNFDAGDMASGERGLLNDPQRKESFRANVPVALEFARRVGIPQLNVLVGKTLPDRSREEQLDLVRENLAWAADQAASAGLGVVVESLNAFENSGYLLTNTHDLLKLLAEVGRPNLKYQYDIYHMQRMEGNIIATLQEHIDRIGHIQVADSPNRHEPGTGEIHYPHVLAALETLNYQGYIGLEYNPSTSSKASFAWLPQNKRTALRVSDLHL